jgi:hypothetical protein
LIPLSTALTHERLNAPKFAGHETEQVADMHILRLPGLLFLLLWLYGIVVRGCLQQGTL